MSRKPWYPRYGGDFIMGTMDLTLEESGAYSKLLDMLYDRGRPIPDEPRWIAGFLNCSVRKWGQLRESLLAAGKITLRDGYLSNPRFERQLGQDQEHQEQRREWGHRGGKKRAEKEREARKAAQRARQPELGFEPENGDENGIISGLSPDKPEIIPGSGEDKSRELNGAANNSSDLGQGNLKHARASRTISRDRDTSVSLSSRAKPKPKSRNRAKAARKMPKGWEPAELTAEVQGIVSHWPSGMILRELGRFRDWASGNGATKKDWDAAWRNWIRKADDDWKRTGARPLGKRSGWAKP